MKAIFGSLRSLLRWISGRCQDWTIKDYSLAYKAAKTATTSAALEPPHTVSALRAT